MSGLGIGFLSLLLLWTAPPVWASFSLVPNGVVTQLPTGASPLGTLSGVVIDLSGILYVADTTNSQIVKIAADRVTVSTLSITGLSPALSSPSGLAIDSAGNLYIADTGNNRVVEVSPSGAGSVISTASITLNAPQGVAVDVSGDVFISDTGNSRIVKVPSGGTAAVFTITGLSPVLSNQRGIAVDPYGNLYIADTGNSRVVKVSSTGAAGTSLTTADGTALDGPSGVAVGNNGVLYIADTNTSEYDHPTPGRIVIVDSQGNPSELLTGYPVFNSPRAIAVSPMGALYVVDNGGTANAGRVQSFQSFTVGYSYTSTSSVGFGHAQLGSAGTSITIPFDVGSGITLSSISVYTAGTQNLDFTIANDSTCVTGAEYGENTDCTVDVTFSPTAAGLRKGALVLNYGERSLTVPIFGVADAPVAALSPGVASVINIGSASLGSPFQTAVDGEGNIYVTNYGSNTVVKIPAGGGSGTTVSTGSYSLSQPTGIALDAAGNLFIADYGNSRIIEVAVDGTASLFAISGLSESIDLPTALAFDGAGNLYITDYGIGRMVEVTPYGQGTVLATGSVTFSETSITGTAVDTTGNVYIADRTNNRIVKVDPLGTTTLLSFSSVGTLSNPEGVAVDPSGNVYVMDSSNQRIIRITTSGATAVIPFSGVTIGSFIFGITPDASGNILVADWSNNRLVKVNAGQSALTYFSTVVGNTSSDSPKTATVTDLGDQPLVFASAPTYPTDFPVNSGDTNLCAMGTSLSAGTNCDIGASFTPLSPGSLSESVTLTDNALNLSNATQMISLAGTAAQLDATAVSATASPAALTIGQTTTLAAMVTNSTVPATVPTGPVTFMDLVGSTATSLNGGAGIALNGSGKATLANVTLSGAGAHTITMSYAGVNGSFHSSTGSVTVTVNKATATATGLPAQPIQLTSGQAGSIPVTLTGVTGLPLPSGAVTFTITNSSGKAVSSGSVTLVAGTSSSSATVTVPGTLAPGSYTVSLSYSGDTDYGGLALGPVQVQVGQITPGISLASSAAIVLAKNPVTLTAAVSSTAGTPTGTVNFYDGTNTTPLGMGALTAGAATFTTSSLTTGSHSITAIYSGDADFAPVTSAALTEGVEDFTLAISSGAGGTASATTQPGGTATYALVIGPAGATTFPGAVTLTASGLPPGATYTLTPSMLAAGSAQTNVTLAIKVPAQTAAVQPDNRLGNGLAPLALGLLLLPFSRRMRRSVRNSRRNFPLAVLLLAAGAAALAGLAGCSYGSGFLGQTPQTYNVVVTATSGALTHSTTVTLTVE